MRLAGAHADLRNADPSTGVTIAAIAARWGFARPDSFATQYRAAYAIHPSITLHQ